MENMNVGVANKEKHGFGGFDIMNMGSGSGGGVEDSEMRKLIECPVCLEIPLPPIYTCERGHIVCTDCQEKTPSCPLCRGYYCKTRSFIAEGIVEKCTLKCKYADEGCSQVMKGNELVGHVKQCDYRPIHCVDCNGRGHSHGHDLYDFDTEYNESNNPIPFSTYIDHLMQEHKINGVHQTSGFVVYSMDLTRRIQDGVRYCWPPYYFIKDNDQDDHEVKIAKDGVNVNAIDIDTRPRQIFLIRMHVSNSFVTAWVSYVGPKEDCSKFEVTLGFHVPRVCLDRNRLEKNKSKFSLIWKGQANHFREDDNYQDIFQWGGGLTIPVETVKEVGKVSDVLSEWMYQVEITDITEIKPTSAATITKSSSRRSTATAKSTKSTTSSHLKD